MTVTHDPFIGTWRLDPQRSEFDPNHRPSDATMTFAQEPDGHYVLTAEGTRDGVRCAETPQRFTPDDRPYPLAAYPGLSIVSARPSPNTLRVECRREDGSLAGQAVYEVSADGAAISATTSGYDTQLRQFRQFTVWQRVS